MSRASGAGVALFLGFVLVVVGAVLAFGGSSECTGFVCIEDAMFHAAGWVLLVVGAILAVVGISMGAGRPEPNPRIKIDPTLVVPPMERAVVTPEDHDRPPSRDYESRF